MKYNMLPIGISKISVGIAEWNVSFAIVCILLHLCDLIIEIRVSIDSYIEFDYMINFIG